MLELEPGDRLFSPSIRSTHRGRPRQLCLRQFGFSQIWSRFGSRVRICARVAAGPGARKRS